MGVRIEPFGRRHVAEAAGLLAEAGREHGPDTRDPAVARRRVERWAVRGQAGLAAVEDASERLLGFMAVSPSEGRKARVRLDGHAAVAGEQGHLVRHGLFAALSERLTAGGAVVHEVDVLAGDEDVVSSYVRLGFGIDQIKGFRPAAAAVWDPRVRRGRPQDIPRLTELAEEVLDFHRRAPMWQRPDPGVAETVAQGYRRALDDGPGGPHLLLAAEEPGGRLVGLMQAAPDGHFGDAVTIGLAGVTPCSRSVGVGTALLDAVADWAARLGFTRCGAGWTSANPVSDPFWRTRGLVPRTYRMARTIDRPGGSGAPGVRGA